MSCTSFLLYCMVVAKKNKRALSDFCRDFIISKYIDSKLNAISFNKLMSLYLLPLVFYVKVWLVTSCVGSADIDSDGEFEGGLVEDIIIGVFVALFIVVLPTKGISELLSAVGEFEIEGEIENAVSIIRAEPLLSVDGKTLADGKIVTGEG